METYTFQGDREMVKWGHDVLVLIGTPHRHILPPDSLTTLCGYKKVATNEDGYPNGDHVRRFTGFHNLDLERWCKMCMVEYRQRLCNDGSRRGLHGETFFNQDKEEV